MKGDQMAVAIQSDLAEGVGPEQYDAVNAEMQNLDTQPPEGLIFHSAGQAPNGRFRIVDVWESREHFDRFSDERLGPAVTKVAQAAGMEPRDPDVMEWPL